MIKHEWRIYLLLISSIAFYYINQGWYVAFLASSILINYGLCVLWLRSRLRYLIYTAILYNILALAVFKYVPVILFGTEVPDDSIWSRLVLPIGISFYSFQAIGYVLDLYWRDAKQQSSFKNFAFYMTFFPQLLSGPIARGNELLPQIGLKKDFEYENIVSGARLILWGLFKKLVVANNLSPYTDAVFNNVQIHHGLTLVVAVIAYTIQIYMDFSGYSDIAIGSARILGFKLMENFRIPFFAKSVTDFWRRWHISLSSWVRDYVNLPLQYKFRGWGLSGILFSAFITFLIIGVWHGASWSYVVFGLLQGFAITYEVLTQSVRKRFWSCLPKIAGNILSNLLVFGFFSMCTILLRSSLSDAILVLSKMSLNSTGFFWGSKQLLIYAAVGIAIVWIVEFLKGDELFTSFIASKRSFMRWSYYLGSTLLILLIGSLRSENFIYFQF